VVKLPPAELMDVGPIASTTQADVLSYSQASHAPSGDDWSEDENTIYAQASAATVDSHDNFISKESINWPFRVLIQGISNCPTAIPCESVFVEVDLVLNGESLLQQPCATRAVPFSENPRFPQFWIDTRIEIAALPPTSRITFTLIGTRSNQAPARSILAGVSITLVDYRRHVVTGDMILNMFPHESLQEAIDPVKFSHESKPEVLNVRCCVPGGNSICNAGTLHLVFDSYSVPVVAEMVTLNDLKASVVNPALPISPTPATIKSLQIISRRDAIDPLTTTDKDIIWANRQYCMQFPQLLPKFLQSVSWLKKTDVKVAHQCLVAWAPLNPVEAMELLDIRYCDPVVREYAVRIIDQLSDKSLQEFILQLVQVLKYEAYHDSPLARLLLRRALRSPLMIGHHFFWMLKSEIHCSTVMERFGTLLCLYIHNCGPHGDSLRKQSFVNDKIKVIADKIKTISSKEGRTKASKQELEQLHDDLPAKFCLCLTPRIECKGIKFKKCKVMDSKKLPLWVVFENADPFGKDFYTIFKSGDDLRQDQITLQLLRIMDTIWRGTDPTLRLLQGDGEESPLDLKLKPYKCCATGKDLGMIEVVVDSDTTANIMTAYGGRLTGAFSNTPFHNYLRENSSQGYSQAVENFVRSCAGYCVATYVLGIGDRHAGNIMVSKSGHLFHIDFGHFLGNFKQKYGIKRERAPFVFTPAMAYIMTDSKISGTSYSDFVRLCCDAYNRLRRRAALFINLFILMVPAAMPELMDRTDITYLREMLSTELTVEQANAKFNAEIKNSLNTVTRQVDNFFHTLRH
jgi:phosphatidylinositol-4,5-bisphosphate 3-kinase catalytic subunit alpha/beta/delta